MPFCGILLCVLILILIFQTVNPQFARLIALAAGVFCVLYALGFFSRVISFFRDLGEETSYGSYFTILLKALGVGLLTGALAEICRDFGQGALARGAELIGKGAILVLAFPILEEFLELLKLGLGAGA